MPEAPRAVIWDMDGVLVLSADVHYQSWVEVLQGYGLEMSRDQFEQTFGMSNRDLLRRLYGERLSPAQIGEIADRKEAVYRQRIKGQVEALPGVTDWLMRLSRGGWRQAVASSGPMANIAAIMNELDLWAEFDVVLTGARLPRSKPDPAIFLQAAGALGVEPRRCVVVEDSTVGVEAARRAGMRSVAVTTTHPAAELQAADLIADRLDHLPANTFDRLVPETG